MAVFGWIMLIVLGLFGFGILVLFTFPFIVSEFVAMKIKIERAVDDRKFDVQKRSETRRHRDELKRQKYNELADKKLDVKLQKVDKQIKIYQKKLELAQELKEATQAEINVRDNRTVKPKSSNVGQTEEELVEAEVFERPVRHSSITTKVKPVQTKPVSVEENDDGIVESEDTDDTVVIE